MTQTTMQTVFDRALADVGTYEWAAGSNPKVDRYFDDVGYPTLEDDTAWCAAFVGAHLHRCGFPHTGKLTARSYEDWGYEVPLDEAQPGDVVVFSRGDPDGWQGHVGFYAGQGAGTVDVLGGNQRDQVSIASYPQSRLLSVRRMDPPRPPRTSPLQSTTIQAAAGTATAGATGVAAAIGRLDPTVQIIVAIAGVVALGALAWIVRERLVKWGKGDR